MIRYETLMLIRSEATADELSKIETNIEKLATDAKGSVSSFDRWGKCRLAYPVQKNDYGIYILARYEIPKSNLESFFKETHHLFRIKLNEVVMRHVDIALGKETSFDYARPDAIEGQRAGNLDAFLKENKMEGFLSESKDSKKESEKDETSREPKTEEVVKKVEVIEEKTTEPEVKSEEDEDAQS